jgi:peptidase M28-like protein
MRMMRSRTRLRLSLVLGLLLLFSPGSPRAATPSDTSGAIEPTELREWLGYIASDELEGRQVFTEGLGLAAAYIADHLAAWHVTPAGEDGTYFQTVRVLGVRTSSKASVTVDVNGQTRVFNDGNGIVFPKKMGGKQTLTSDSIEFVGYGLQIPSVDEDDYANVDPAGKVVIFLGPGQKTLPAGSFRLVNARSRNAIGKGAVATIGPVSTGFARGGRPGGTAPAESGSGGAPASPATAPAAARGAGSVDNGDFTTVERYDTPIPPALTATDDFFDFLFSGSDVKYADLKDKVSKGQPLPSVVLKNVKITLNVDADYTVVRTRLTRNVVGIVPGTDAKLRDTYVAFGAHYDHIGYSEASAAPGRSVASFATSCPGQARDTPRPDDNINNGADDDGSGTVGLMALARAFAEGPKPKRSLLFVWHSGEEAGLYGSRYYADHPVVPLDRIVAQLNIDMIGRNRCDDPQMEDTVYLVGSDRISTELHNLNEDANASLPNPLTLNYEMNDPADPESIYTRSDHYSYASKGIPIIFYTTGLHRDYHYVTDEVAKIDFPKLARVTGLVYATGARVANLDHVPVRDNKGPRKGKGSGGKIKG